MNFRSLYTTKVWHLVDCKGRRIDEVAHRVKVALTGEYKPIYRSKYDCGDFVVAINTKHLAISEDQKRILKFITYSGYRGSQKIITLGDFHKTSPTEALRRIVYRLLSEDPYRAKHILRLKAYPGSEHNHHNNIIKFHIDEKLL